jgi:hypothetical protein
MASVLDNQADVLLLRELEPSCYIVCASNVDRVHRKIAVHASSILAERSTRVVLPVRILDGRGVFDTSVALENSAGTSETETYCGSGVSHSAWMLRHVSTSYKAP